MLIRDVIIDLIVFLVILFVLFLLFGGAESLVRRANEILMTALIVR